MRNAKINRLTWLGLTIAGAALIAGCPGNVKGGLFRVGSDRTPEQTPGAAIAQTVTGDAIEFEVCAAVDSWQRPSEADQAKQLGEDARYGQALESDSALKRASEQFWSHDVVSFTTYGLSARMEPVTLAGVWTVADELWDCYEPETTVAINDGDIAETWLLNQQVTSVQWEGDRYIMTVAPAPAGMQVVQFNRVDELAALPLEVVTESGSAVEVVSGDWQAEAVSN
ncbi:MAG: hypothetical protein AAGN15_15670 [Cyanobacteria bacterium J06581_3]